jgi:predicted ArsR family transcriptional regulator
VLPSVPRLDVLKALGDNTRYAVYLELARSPRPLATAEIAESLGLHPNTVRPHLERMRDVGLLQVEIESRGGVGRPQHRYTLAADAPSLGLEPPTMPLLARLLARLAEQSGVGADEAVEVGRAQGGADAVRYTAAPSTLEALVTELDRLGFDPVVGDVPDHDDAAVVAFGHCPFRDVAEEHPDLVCALHRGLVEGFLDTMGDSDMTDFCTLVDRTPCQVSVAVR